MKTNHWSVNLAIIYLILISIVNISISIWSSIEFNQITQNFNEASKNSTVTREADSLIKTAASALIYILLSGFAMLFTTIALLFPKRMMDLIEKVVDDPDADFDSIYKFRLVMVLANSSILILDFYGIVSAFKYL
ncbi:hypothetical protein MHB43_17740 [Paenibacillus sp. FSL H8-0317]|uniref:hypothetical protein n=1 Tax=Paenibacillus TaxID=44249 RepID=UPI0003E2A9AB|nr:MULTISPECIES: hypothetical protein [Paenibacillus]ETT31423.1 hypothetical protein C161_25675 [Paenibacillus sp. FSL R5-192]OMF46445.1 hypothetical protein BK136_07425 [Paenibacillus amylolyticus]PKQ91026.1 hypothetical protein CXK86_13475 [Paenibacillus sp. BGI2013]